MATNYGPPKIISDGLVLCLDAGNPKSYTSVSNTWIDLSGNGKNASKFGAPVFSTDGNGCVDFSTATGAGSYAASMGFTFSSNMVPTTGNFTFECWIKNPPVASQLGMFSNAGGTDGYRFGVGYNGIYYLVGPNYTEATVSWGENLNSSLWYHAVATWDRTNAYRVSIYLNSIYKNFGSMPTTQTAMQNGAPGLVRGGCCGLYTGKIALFKVYNRLLSNQEISQNYNALKSRFGL